MTRPIVGVLAPQGKARRPVANLLPTGVRKRLIYPDSPPRARGSLSAVINWGCSTTPHWWDFAPLDTLILNPPPLVQTSTNKMTSFLQMDTAIHAYQLSSVRTVPFTDSPVTALHWLEDGERVFARTVLNGHSGRGIVVVSAVGEPSADMIPSAPLYTKCIRRSGLREFRVYFGGGRVLDVALKRRRTDFDGEIDPLVRSWHNGWVFSRQMPRAGGPPESLLRDIVLVGDAVLNWGAVDVLIDTRDYSQPAYILEVNSRPGIDDSRTRAAYADFFSRWIRSNFSTPC